MIIFLLALWSVAATATALAYTRVARWAALDDEPVPTGTPASVPAQRAATVAEAPAAAPRS